MIDFEFEFQYAEENAPVLRRTAGSIPKGRCVVLCGGSGCGKSTLLRCINGLIPQFYEGELKGFCRLAGKDTDGLSIGEIGELAASVFQDPRSQFFTVNSSNEVAFGLENHGLPQEKIQQRVDEAFRIFHLEHLKDRNVYELSSGERQLISILSAWAMDTDIFLLDEPTANLDFAATQQLKRILLALKNQGKTLLLSEHRLYYLTDIADAYWVMADGEIRQKYTAAEAGAISQEQLHTLCLRTLDLDKIDVQEKEPLPGDTPQALTVLDVRYKYGGKQDAILSSVDFSIREHEIVGLVGANGCGKTTIGKVIAGLYRPSGGQIKLFETTQKPKQLQKQVLFILQEAEFQFFTNSVLHELQYGHTVTPEFEKRTEALLKSMGMWELPQPPSVFPVRWADAEADADDGISFRQAACHIGRADSRTGRRKPGTVHGTDPRNAERKDRSHHHPRSGTDCGRMRPLHRTVGRAYRNRIFCAFGTGSASGAAVHGAFSSCGKKITKETPGAFTPGNKAALLDRNDGRNIYGKQPLGLCRLCGADTSDRR